MFSLVIVVIACYRSSRDRVSSKVTLLIFLAFYKGTVLVDTLSLTICSNSQFFPRSHFF